MDKKWPPRYPLPNCRAKGDSLDEVKEGDILFFPYRAREGFYLAERMLCRDQPYFVITRNFCAEKLEKDVFLICGNISDPTVSKKWEWWEDVEFGWHGKGWSDWWNWPGGYPDFMSEEMYSKYYH